MSRERIEFGAQTAKPPGAPTLGGFALSPIRTVFFGRLAAMITNYLRKFTVTCNSGQHDLWRREESPFSKPLLP
jgi:hypothetical protein